MLPIRTSSPIGRGKGLKIPTVWVRLPSSPIKPRASKETHFLMESKNVPIGKIHAYLGGNHSRRRDDTHGWFDGPTDLTRLAVALTPGWQVSNGRMGLFPLTEDEIKLALKEKETEHQRLKANRESYEARMPDGKRITVTASEYLRAWEESYINKSGYVRPTHGVVWGNRRSVAIILANAILFKMEQAAITEIPAEINTYTSELEKVEACILENCLKNVGVRALSIPDYIHAGIEMYMNSCPEVRFRKAFKAVKGIDGQKLFALVRLIIEHPDLQIMERIVQNEISYPKLDKEIMRQLHDTKATDADVAEYINNLDKSKVRSDKMLSKKDIEGLANQCPIIIGRELAKGILTNNVGPWNSRFVPKHRVINVLIEALFDPEKAPLVIKLAEDIGPKS